MTEGMKKGIIVIISGIGNTVFCMLIAFILLIYQDPLDGRIFFLWILYIIGSYLINKKLMRKICADKPVLPFLSLLSSFALAVFVLLSHILEILGDFSYAHHYGHSSGGWWIPMNLDALGFYIMLLHNLIILLVVCIKHCVYIMNKRRYGD